MYAHACDVKLIVIYYVFVIVLFFNLYSCLCSKRLKIYVFISLKLDKLVLVDAFNASDVGILNYYGNKKLFFSILLWNNFNYLDLVSQTAYLTLTLSNSVFTDNAGSGHGLSPLPVPGVPSPPARLQDLIPPAGSGAVPFLVPWMATAQLSPGGATVRTRVGGAV